MDTKSDYRNSHTAPEYGQDYHRSFKTHGYRKYIWSVEKEILSDIVKIYCSGGADNMLDFACGTGRVLSHLEPCCTQSVGLDISMSMLDIARTQVLSSTLITGDITRESNLLGAQSFDLITAFRFFLRAQPSLRDEVMKELVHHLDADGHVVFNIHNNKTSIANRISKIYTKIKYGAVVQRDEMSFDEVQAFTRSHGLEIIATYPYGTFPVFREDQSFSKSLVRLFDKYFSSTTTSSFVIYVCKKR